IWEPFLFGSPSAPITFPKARMLPVLKMRSDPAKSTKWNLEDSICGPELAVVPLGLKIVCERLELGFICVAPVCLAVFPDSSKLSTSSRASTSHSFTPHRTIVQMKKNTKTHKDD
uniref:Uncharacterized protein n=1 Tax=Oryzias melastigma TaxID=30732 RepID=A0A3B3B8F0_ORYME